MLIVSQAGMKGIPLDPWFQESRIVDIGLGHENLSAIVQGFEIGQCAVIHSLPQ